MGEKICLSGFDLDDLVELSTATRLYGCKPVLSNCESEIMGGDNKYIVESNGRKIIICWEKEAKCTILLNQYRRGFYLHILLEDEHSISYATKYVIDHRVFTGIFYCLLKQKLGLREAFTKAMETIVVGEGDPFKYFRIVVKEYNSIYRLINALDRLIKNNELLSKLLVNQLLLGVKPVENKMYIVKIYGATPYTYISPLQVIDTRIDNRYDKIGVGLSFICSEVFTDKKYRELISETGFTIELIDDNKCLIGEDIMKLIIFLEKTRI